MVSKKFEISRTQSQIDGLEVPAKVDKGVRRAGGFDNLMRRIPDSKLLQMDARKHLALSDQTRLRILWSLSSSDLCPCLLKRITRVSDSKLSYHLRILERAGLIRSRRTMNWWIYSITKAGLAALKPTRQ